MHTATAQSHGKPHSHQHVGHSASATAIHGSAAKPKRYNPRHPERTLLYQTVAEHFESWLELACAGQFDGQGDHHSPKPYVRKAFAKYLECGRLGQFEVGVHDRGLFCIIIAIRICAFDKYPLNKFYRSMHVRKI